MNPYWGTNFFTFFKVLFTRLIHADFASLASDEVQLIVLSCIGISCGLIGPFLVLKKMSMFANSLSHTILLGIVISFLCLGSASLDFSHLLIGALVASLLTAVLTEGLIKKFHLTEDASIGLIFTFLFALGIILVTLFVQDLHLGVEAVMGNADALQPSDIKLSLLLVAINGSAILWLYRPLQLVSFDASLGRTLGLPCGMLHFFLMFLAAATCIGAFRSVGVLLVLAFLVGPYLTARLFCHRLPYLLLLSCGLGILASLCAVAFTRNMLSMYDIALSTGGCVVCFIGLFYLIAVLFQSTGIRRQNLSPYSSRLE